MALLLDNGTIAIWPITENELVNLTFTTQFMVLPVSFVALAIMYFYDRNNFKQYFRFPIATDDWSIYGPLAAVGFTIGTGMMMSFNVIREHGEINDKFIDLLPLVLLFSATNAWSEEIFSRFVIVSGLSGKLQPATICLISAVIFGAGHIFGTPSGLFGMIASGTLGWVLAKSVVDTKGMTWALIIHFLQDVMIFGAGAMVIAGQH